MLNILRKIFGVHSPSVEMRKQNEIYGKGMAEGIETEKNDWLGIFVFGEINGNKAVLKSRDGKLTMQIICPPVDLGEK